MFVRQTLYQPSYLLPPSTRLIIFKGIENIEKLRNDLELFSSFIYILVTCLFVGKYT